MSTNTIDISPELDRRIEELARAQGRPKDEFVRGALVQFLADQDDVELARRRLVDRFKHFEPPTMHFSSGIEQSGWTQEFEWDH